MISKVYQNIYQNSPPPIKRDCVAPLAGNEILDYTKKQIQTREESRFLDSLINHLKHSEVSEIGLQEIFVIPLSRRHLVRVKNQSKQLPSQYVLRRPDFACEKVGLVIEIDGSAHDSCDKRVNADLTREHNYAILDFHCFRISNEQVYDATQRQLVIKEILLYISNEIARPDFKRRYAKRRKILSRARKAFIAKNPKIYIGSFDRKSRQKKKILNHNSSRQWGGFRINLKHKPRCDENS